MTAPSPSPQGLLVAIDDRISARSLLKHPFYRNWSAGALTLDALRGYARQYYHHVLAFPTYVSGAHANCDDLADRQTLLDNLLEEEQGEDNHPELWLRFCQSLGLRRQEVVGSPLLPQTRALIDTYRGITKDGSFVEAVAALYAYESQVPEVAATKIDGLRRFYGIEDRRGLQFFIVHKSLDVEHAAATRGLIAKYAASGHEQQKALDAVDRCLGALWGFLDGVHGEYVDR